MSDLERFQAVPTTSRSGDFLARRHGFGSLTNLAGSLPREARVIDVGAGASTLGREVATLRSDIHWINFDFSYSDPDILEEVSAHAPENMDFTPGDATKLDEIYGHDNFDAVFSYWLIPHLSLYSTRPAKEAATAMFNIAKNEGTLSVGPTRGIVRSILGKPLTYVATKETGDTAEEFAEDVVGRTRLRGPRLVVQRVINEALAEVYDSTHNTKQSPRLGLEQILVPTSGKYHSILHPAALPTVARLGFSLARQSLRPANYSKVTD